MSKRWTFTDVIFLCVGQKDMVYSENELAFLSKVHLLLLYDIDFDIVFRQVMVAPLRLISEVSTQSMVAICKVVVPQLNSLS